jgi:hypothetical protein
LQPRCKCGRRATGFDGDGPCYRCEEKRSRRRDWQRYGGIELIDHVECIGVGRQFCKGDKVPTMDDEGLRERIAARPLPEGGIFAVGPAGSHKTHLLAARTVDAARRGWTAQMVNWSRFVLEVRATYQRKAHESELDVLKRYSELDYLAIDDLGADSGSEAVVLVCYELLDARYACQRATDVSSNLTPTEIAERYDARIGRRLAELCNVYPMLLGESVAKA